MVNLAKVSLTMVNIINCIIIIIKYVNIPMVSKLHYLTYKYFSLASS
jgi:hypothetical protein